MNILDIIICIPLAWGAFKGFKKGFILSISSVVSLILGIYVGTRFSSYAAGYMRDHWDFKTQYVNIMAFIIVFILVLIIVFFIAKLIERFVKITSMGWLNTLSGAAFGIIKMVLIVSTVIFILNAIGLEKSLIPVAKQNSSMLYQPVAKCTPALIPKLKEMKLKEYLDQKTDSLKIEKPQ